MTHGNPWKLLFLKMLNQTKTNYLRKLGFLIQTNSECRLQFGTFVFLGFLWHPNMSVSVKTTGKTEHINLSIMENVISNFRR